MRCVQTTARPIKPEMPEKIKTGQLLVHDDWTQMSARLPVKV